MSVEKYSREEGTEGIEEIGKEREKQKGRKGKRAREGGGEEKGRKPGKRGKIVPRYTVYLNKLAGLTKWHKFLFQCLNKQSNISFQANTSSSLKTWAG